jgi:hypothetical protein
MGRAHRSGLPELDDFRDAIVEGSKSRPLDAEAAKLREGRVMLPGQRGDVTARSGVVLLLEE